MIDLARVHPMLVHFPIVLFLVVPLFDAYLLARGGDLAAPLPAQKLLMALMALGAAFGFAAAVFGDTAYNIAVAKGFKATALEDHARLGSVVAWFFVALAAVRGGAMARGIRLGGGRGWVLWAFGVAGAILILLAAYRGGGLVYGLGVNVEPVKPR